MPWVIVSTENLKKLPNVKASDPDWFLIHARMMDIDNPSVWRQLLVPSDATMPNLQLLMTCAFGWANCHMHQWSIRKVDHIEGYDNPDNWKSELNPKGFKVPLVAFDYRNVDKAEESDQSDDYMGIDHGLPDDMTLDKLQTKYKLAQNKHVIHYEYDMGDSWEHILLVERKIKAKEVMESGILGSLNAKGTKRTVNGKSKEFRVMAKITGGHGHGVAEDVGSWPGWENLKEAYKAKNTKKDEEEYEEIREWYEEDCGNGDPRGLKGKNRLEHFSVREANSEYEMALENVLKARR